MLTVDCSGINAPVNLATPLPYLARSEVARHRMSRQVKTRGATYTVWRVSRSRAWTGSPSTRRNRGGELPLLHHYGNFAIPRQRRVGLEDKTAAAFAMSFPPPSAAAVPTMAVG